MESMFYYCRNLNYINLENAKINSSLKYTGIFDGRSFSIIICSKYENGMKF